MATYDEIARDVSNWANRDTGVLDYDRIKQCLVFAHDEIYRTCRIASIEGRFDYEPITAEQAEDGALAIPQNAVEFIQLRKLFDGRGANSASANRFTVAEARNDIRSFYGDATSRYSNYSYSRERDRLLVYPGLTEDEDWQLYYYYRFEDPFERLPIIKENGNLMIALSDDELADLIVTDGSIRDTDESFTFWTVDHPEYNINDFVEYSGNLYQVTEAIPTNSIPEWDVTTGYLATDTVFVDERIFTVLETIAAIPAWNAEDTYVLDQEVSFENNIYSANGPIPGDASNTDPSVDTTNWSIGVLISTLQPGADGQEDNYADAPEFYPDTIDAYDLWGLFPAATGDTVFIGALEENWFRDANEKALLFGALHQAFDYLDEQDQSGKFKAKFEQEIQKLNDEERRRQVLGGNVQTNFYSVLI